MRDEGRRAPLHRIRPRLAHGLAAGHVGAHHSRAEHVEAHPRHAERCHRFPAMGHGDGRQYAVGGAREAFQHPCRVSFVLRLAQDFTAQRHRGVRAQDGCRRQATPLVAGHGGVQLECRHPLHIGSRRFLAVHGLNGFGVFAQVAIGVGHQQLVGHAELLQQLAAARALGGEVDECRHGFVDQIGLMRPEYGGTQLSIQE